MRTKKMLAGLLCLSLGFATNGGAPLAEAKTHAEEKSQSEIEAALRNWMADFNDKKLGKVCDLFAKTLKSDYRGQPERGYDRQCEILHQSLTDPSRDYRYGVDIKEILVSGNVAMVRLDWTLTLKPKDAAAVSSIESSLDIFQRQPDGQWKIVRYMAYEQ